MLKIYQNHNKHWASLEEFENNDPHLSKLKNIKWIAQYDFNKEFNSDIPGIYTLSGGRQLGKSTCFKQQMLKLARLGVKPLEIFYLACDTLLDRHDFYQVLKYFLENNVSQKGYLFIDEVTFVKGWDLTIKALADEGLFENVVCCLSGSDKIFLEDAIYRLPGRRGKSECLDFTIKPLLFHDLISLFSNEDGSQAILDECFSQYMITGGYITAINDFYEDKEVGLSTYRVYQQWIIGDFIRLNRNQKNLLQILFAIINCYGSQVSFQTLSQHTEGLSKDTVNEYCSILERLGVIGIQHALDQNKLRAAPKKYKKIHFLDPFIACAMHQLVDRQYQRLKPFDESLLIESICYNYFKRKYPTYYIKGDGEVDIAYVDKDCFFPVEVKWRNQIRAKDLKQIKKYANAFILAKQKGETIIDGVKTLSLVFFLSEPDTAPGAR